MKKVDVLEAFSQIKPEHIAFVISYDKANKRANGMIAAWVTKTSFNPPLILVSVGKTRYTHKLIRESGEFVIAFPSKKLTQAVKFFGSAHGNKIDKFKEAKVKTQKAKYVNLPLLSDAIVNFECKLEKEIDTGDHTIFIGKVLAAYLNKGKMLFNIMKGRGGREFREL